jgi:MoxR-like ATPase
VTTGDSARSEPLAQGHGQADDSVVWPIYLGTSVPHDRIGRLRPPPPWRTFYGEPLIEDEFGAGVTDETAARRLGHAERARAYRADEQVVRMVNAALHLRRPLLAKGLPGTGKSTLAYSIAHELKLGPVLHWPITSRSTLSDGLYQYDALGRLQEASMLQYADPPASGVPHIGKFIRLGPLGTALLPRSRPRVLLVDELDKSDIDLPNDLLHVFEEGRFMIPELARLPDEQSPANVFTADGAEPVPVYRGEIRCNAFPVIIISTNGEREFAPAVNRRCIQLTIQPPGADRLVAIITAQLGGEAVADAEGIIRKFLTNREEGDIATDQLLNAIYFATSGAPRAEWDAIQNLLISPIGPAGAK